jgi:hypothetical protein
MDGLLDSKVRGARQGTEWNAAAVTSKRVRRRTRSGTLEMHFWASRGPHSSHAFIDDRHAFPKAGP